MKDSCVPIWTDATPGAHGDRLKYDIPTLDCFFPGGETSMPRAAMIICPGGGYWELMDDYEGRDYALWLNELGIAAFVLTYRLASNGYHHPAITGDVTRAIRYVRYFARDWNLDAQRIGVMGSSAGGHLASYAATHFQEHNPSAQDPIDRVSSRPDLAVLCYAVISMEVCQVKNLMGPVVTPVLIRELSSDQNVTPSTPPCFLWHTERDPTVKVEHARLFAEALHQHNVDYALHIYPEGSHGIGLGVRNYDSQTHKDLHPWTEELHRWLDLRGFCV